MATRTEPTERAGTSAGHPSTLHWVAQSNRMVFLLLNTFPMRMMEMFGEAGDFGGFAPLPIVKGRAPSIDMIKGNQFSESIRKRTPLTFTVLSRGSDEIKVRLFIEYSDRLLGEDYCQWMLGGTLAAHNRFEPNKSPNGIESTVVILFDAYHRTGHLYFTPWMMNRLCEGKTLI